MKRTKYVATTSVRFSYFDFAVVQYLRKVSNREYAEQIRASLRLFARHLPEFDAEGFAEFCEGEVLPTIKKDWYREQFIQQTNAFLESFESDLPVGEDLDRLNTFESGTSKFEGSADDFDLD